MKKIILFAALVLSSIMAQAQISATGNGEEITEGKVFVFNTTQGQGSNLGLGVTNESEQDIRIKLKVMNIINGDNLPDNMVQLCLGEDCYYDIQLGTSVPFDTGGLLLTPGQSNGIEDHFKSAYAGDGGTGVEYVLAYIEVDAAGTQIGNPLVTFSYKYEPSAGLNDFASLKNMGITVNNTVVKNTLNIDATVNATANIYSINGQSIKSAEIKNGSQSIDLSALNSAIYIIKFTTEDNKTSQIRIVKN